MGRVRRALPRGRAVHKHLEYLAVPLIDLEERRTDAHARVRRQRAVRLLQMIAHAELAVSANHRTERAARGDRACIESHAARPATRTRPHLQRRIYPCTRRRRWCGRRRMAAHELNLNIIETPEAGGAGHSRGEADGRAARGVRETHIDLMNPFGTGTTTDVTQVPVPCAGGEALPRATAVHQHLQLV